MKPFVQFIKFGFVGVSNTALSYGVYCLLTFLGVPYMLSNVVGYFVGMVNSFFWNNCFVFKSSASRNLLSAFIKMVIVYSSTGILFSNVLLFFLVDKLGLSKYIAPIFVLLVTIPLNFFLNKFWSFKSTEKETPNENDNGSSSNL